MQLEEIVDSIEQAFGETPPLSSEPPGPAEQPVLDKLFHDDQYQFYLQDLHNRQIIREYLVNAVVLGTLAEERLAAFTDRVATWEGRSVLSLHMLMSSVEEAENLAQEPPEDDLKPLVPGSDAPPFMKLVP